MKKTQKKPLYTIEPASASERKIAEKHFKEYEENPASFVPWERRVITEPASPEETAMCDERMRDYDKDPSSFVTFKRLKKE